ncbi:MAG: exodeoxyribonuclease VII large subunit [Actinobacteria bacterium]|nr:exodeoxyribonuclease VII large subunit [Actinomycetota bacterium]
MDQSDPAKPGLDPEAPLAVHSVSTMIGEYIGRLGTIWVEGQLAEVNPRKGLTYISLRDTDRDVSLSLYVASGVMESLATTVEQGSRVLVQVKADWWAKRGSLQFKVLQMRAVGIGELMARLEALRNLLAAEGLFNEDRKKPLPFLPRRIGLICGQSSDAMHDVIENAKRRWPDVQFEVREVAVQGVNCVRQVSSALTELDAISDIDVIVIARGGGAFEDLLPFSDESLIRVVASVDTPVVAAIGHEEDRPLIDYVADYRASTPTDAARKIVPDVLQEISDLRNARSRIQALISAGITKLEQQLALTRSRPALASPATLITQRINENNGLRSAMHIKVRNFIELEGAHLNGTNATLRALSPQGTLERGFSIVRNARNQIVKSASNAKPGDELRIKFAEGEIVTRVEES